MKLSQFRSKFAWFILGLSLVTVLGSYVTTVMFDSAYFTATDTSVSLKGSLTNFAKLTTNAFQEAGSYQPAAGTLTNASTNAFTGAGLIVLQTAVPENQTNATLASLGGVAKVGDTMTGPLSVPAFDASGFLSSNIDATITLNFSDTNRFYWLTLTNGNVTNVVYANPVAGKTATWYVRGCSTNSSLWMTNITTSKNYPGNYAIVIPANCLCKFVTQIGETTDLTNSWTSGGASSYVP